MEGTIGEIRLFGGNFAPRTWAFCNGQLLPINSNQALFSIIGTIYGGDGRTTFALPDLRGRVAISPGRGPGLSDYRQGPGGGIETVTLNLNTLPNHNHAAVVRTQLNPADGKTPVNGVRLAQAGAPIYTQNVNGNTADLGGVEIGTTGGGQPFSVVQPWCGVHYVICLQGVFPSRS